MSDLYSSTCRDSATFGEKNDCAVIALSIFLDVTYAEAHAALAKHGRKARKGTKRLTTSNAVAELRPDLKIKKYYVKEARSYTPQFEGYKPIEEIKGNYPRLYKTKNFTVKHLEWFPEPWKDVTNALVFVNRHVLAFRDGKVEDWTKGKRKHIQEIWVVEEAEAEKEAA